MSAGPASRGRPAGLPAAHLHRRRVKHNRPLARPPPAPPADAGAAENRSPLMRSRSNRAFTLVELLVVIGHGNQGFADGHAESCLPEDYGFNTNHPGDTSYMDQNKRNLYCNLFW